MSQATLRTITTEHQEAIWSLRPQVEKYPISLMESITRHEAYEGLLDNEFKCDDLRMDMYLSAREAEVAHIIRAPAEDVHRVHEKARILLKRMIESGAHLEVAPCDAADFGLFASIVQDLERLSKAEIHNFVDYAAA